MKTAKEQLIEELNKLEYSNGDPTSFADCDIELLANFIIARERHIVEPLVKELNLLKSYFEDRREVVLHVNDIDWKSINESLKNLGIEL